MRMKKPVKETNEEGGEKKFLSSKRFDMIYVPNTSWDFFDAFTDSQQSRAAFEREEISTVKKNTAKYLSLTAKVNLEEQRARQAKGVIILPDDIVNLLKLQMFSGKFEDYLGVLHVLNIPSDVRFRRDEVLLAWEKATAFAIAYLRQHTEYFDALVEQHDKASTWLTTNELIYEARELIVQHQIRVPLNATTDGAVLEYEPLDPDLVPNDTISVTDMASLQCSRDTRKPYQKPTRDLGGTTGKAAAAITAAGDDEPVVPESAAMDVSDVKAKFVGLQQTLKTLTAAKDPIAIAAQQKKLEEIQVNVIKLCITIENLVKDLVTCRDRCVAAYSSAEICTERYKTFNELTARLGDGQAPIEGFFDWRKDGVPGLRPVMIDFFLEVQLMAEARLDLEELLTPEGRSLRAVNDPHVNMSRWSLVWGGCDVVLKVLHSLDFLRKCRELFEWYGPAFYFGANPLMLPFHMQQAYDQLNFEPKVMEQVNSVAHLRIGNAILENRESWQHQQFLNQWRRNILNMMENWTFNWPSKPLVKEDLHNQRLYNAMLCIFIRCRDSVKTSFNNEKKFMHGISTLRGQDAMLEGKPTTKLNKKLEIPTQEQREFRPPSAVNKSAAARKRAAELMKLKNPTLSAKASNKMEKSMDIQLLLPGEGSLSTEDQSSSQPSSSQADLQQTHNRAAAFTGLLQQAGEGQRQRLADSLKAKQVVAKVDETAAVVSKVGFERNRVPSVFVKDAAAAMRSRSAGTMVVRSGSSGGSGLRKASTLSALNGGGGSQLSSSGGGNRKSSTLSTAGSIVGGGSRKSSMASTAGSVLVGGGASGRKMTRKSTILSKLGSLKEEEGAAGVSGVIRKSSSRPSSGKIPSLGPTLSEASEASDDADDGRLQQQKMPPPLTKLASTTGLSIAIGGSPKASTAADVPSSSSGGVGKTRGNSTLIINAKNRNTVLASLKTAAATGNKNLNSSISNNSDDDNAAAGRRDTVSQLSPLKGGGKRKKSMKPSTAGSSLGGAGGLAGGSLESDDSDGGGGRATRIGSKQFIAQEIGSSRKVTRLPPVQQDGVKMTRRKDSVK